MNKKFFFTIVLTLALSASALGGCDNQHLHFFDPEDEFAQWKITKETSCSEAGSRERRCSLCFEMIVEEIPALPHTYETSDEGEEVWTVRKDPSCSEQGQKSRKCTVCGQEQTSSIDKLPHNYGEWNTTKQATCTENGLRASVCTSCGQKREVGINLAPHRIEGETCKVCGLTASHDLLFEQDESAEGYVVAGRGNLKAGERTTLFIPATHEGMPVIGIKEDAFKTGCGDLVSLVIPESVEWIENNAFSGLSSLESVFWNAKNCKTPAFDPNTKSTPFQFCAALSDLVVGDCVESFPDHTFYNSPLKYATFGSGLTKIGPSTFENCSNLCEVNLPASLKEIGERAFYGCEQIDKLVIPDKTEKIGGEAFTKLANLQELTLPASVKEVGEDAFSRTGITSLKIEGAAVFSYHSFSASTRLESLDLGETVEIGKETFYGCTSLIEVNIPSGVKKIGDRAFQNCKNLAKVTLSDELRAIGWDAFLGTALYNDETNWEDGVLYIGKHLIKAEKTIGREYKLKEGTITIAALAFVYCVHLNELDVGDSLQAFGYQAMFGCNALKEIKYGGTKESWEKIEKGEDWNLSSSCKPLDFAVTYLS